MTDVDVSRYSYSQLLELKRRLDGEIEQKRSEELKVLVDGFAKKLVSLGFTADEAIQALAPYCSGSASKPRAKRVADKSQIPFYDPANSQNRWSGHGRAPKWLKDYEAAGRNREEFRVVQLLESTPTDTQ